MIKQLSEDSQAILLLCSNLGTGRLDDQKIKPYSLAEWNKLANQIVNSELKSPKALFHTNPSNWKQQLSLSSSEFERIQSLLANGANLSLELNNLTSYGIWVTTRAEETYPILLKNRLKLKCPVYLYGAGNASLLNTPGIAIVGSRETDEDGMSFTQRLAQKAALEGYSIISGGARGVDSIAQNAALSVEGTVISILADSLEAKIRNKDTRLAIQKKQLLLLSPFHPKAGFKVYTAMERNKYIYALSQYSVAVSSDYNKGGTWSGAQENLSAKWVPLFVRQEPSIPKGNIELIKVGAYPLHREILTDTQTTMSEWMKATSESKSLVQHEGQSLFDMAPQEVSPVLVSCNGDLMTTSEEISKSNIGLEIVPESVEVATSNLSNVLDKTLKTAYDCVLPLLLENMIEPITIEELSGVIGVRKAQTQDWIDQMMEELLVMKLSRPVRYVRKTDG